MPICQYFLKGKCNRDDCPYSHVNVGRHAGVCEDFLKGYCALGFKVTWRLFQIFMTLNHLQERTSSKIQMISPSYFSQSALRRVVEIEIHFVVFNRLYLLLLYIKPVETVIMFSHNNYWSVMNLKPK